MWLKAQNGMEGVLPHAAMGPVERMVRPHLPQHGQPAGAGPRVILVEP